MHPGVPRLLRTLLFSHFLIHRCILFGNYYFVAKPICQRKMKSYIFYLEMFIFYPSQYVQDKWNGTFIIWKLLFCSQANISKKNEQVLHLLFGNYYFVAKPICWREFFYLEMFIWRKIKRWIECLANIYFQIYTPTSGVWSRNLWLPGQAR